MKEIKEGLRGVTERVALLFDYLWCVAVFGYISKQAFKFLCGFESFDNHDFVCRLYANSL
ncbi:MAG: hypothetical protein L6V95_13985 [Candidatus Melainabacteria bacterium]|nr:MAG: hypothetical protein L6V95_13985 [Candidatus Melainabacteria bacterium]